MYVPGLLRSSSLLFISIPLPIALMADLSQQNIAILLQTVSHQDNFRVIATTRTTIYCFSNPSASLVPSWLRLRLRLQLQLRLRLLNTAPLRLLSSFQVGTSEPASSASAASLNFALNIAICFSCRHFALASTLSLAFLRSSLIFRCAARALSRLSSPITFAVHETSDRATRRTFASSLAPYNSRLRS
jgi:hypothetical protein